MRNPNELKVFKLADDLVMAIFGLTAAYPASQRYGLTSQMQRAVVSIASNLVEGCSRESQADFRRFVEIALGSAMELRYQLTIGRRLQFHDDLSIEDKTGEVVKMLTSLAKALRAET